MHNIAWYEHIFIKLYTSIYISVEVEGEKAIKFSVLIFIINGFFFILNEKKLFLYIEIAFWLVFFCSFTLFYPDWTELCIWKIIVSEKSKTEKKKLIGVEMFEIKNWMKWKKFSGNSEESMHRYSKVKKMLVLLHFKLFDLLAWKMMFYDWKLNDLLWNSINHMWRLAFDAQWAVNYSM